MNSQRGFTLMELLIVFAIVALLASIVLVATTGQRDHAVNLQRLAAVKQIQIALESYLNDHGSFPLVTTTSINQFGETIAAPVTIADPGWATLSAYLAPRYIAELPTMPITYLSGDYHQQGYLVDFSNTNWNVRSAWGLDSTKGNWICMYPPSYAVGVSFKSTKDSLGNAYTAFGQDNGDGGYVMPINYMVWGGNVRVIQNNLTDTFASCPINP